MYSPAHYQETDFKKIQELIERNAFATLIAGETISHLPMMLESVAGEPELLCHMARANPQWRELQRAPRAKIIFHGPQAYISPAWYNEAADNVPTWSYAVVHVEGKFELIEKPDEAVAVMEKLIARFEDANGTSWRLPSFRDEVNALMNAITVFKFRGLKFNAKFKLNQKQELDERRNVQRELKQSGDSTAIQLAELMAAFE
jgi:transcriptional regulator